MTVHLALYSGYSLLRGTAKIKDLVQQAKEDGYTALALTDHHVMYGIPAFARACAEAGIHPLYGMEVTVNYHDEEVPFIMIAKDNAGYRSLMKLSTALSRKSALSAEEFRSHGGHCQIIAYGEGGWLDSELLEDDREGVRSRLAAMQQELPPFDVALSYQETSLWRMKNAMLKRIASTLNIRTVALNRIYYLSAEDAYIHRVLNGIRTGKVLSDQSLPMMKGRYFLNPEEMAALYDADDLKRTDEIAAMCRADLKLPPTSLPSFETPQGHSSAQYLTQLCLAGLRKRLKGKEDPVYLKRLKYELDTIIKMHFEDYFLIVYDFIRYARKEGIYVGPGRGSAAGSLTAYTLGITQIDPIQYGLLFERFLNPERVTMPDIDTDIPDDRRQDVISYVFRKYGYDHTANIITFGTLKARQVIRDVGKVMDLPQHRIDQLVSLIPASANITLQEAVKQNPRLKERISVDEQYAALFDTAQRLEGLPRHTSVHAGGVLFSRLPLTDIVPALEDEQGMMTSQYSMEYLEERGLIKMDILGLRNLSVIDEIVRSVKQDTPDFDIMSIPLDDPRTYSVFQNVDTLGIFQFDSEGMKNLLRRLQPSRYEDIVAAIALFRPGPMEHIPEYLANKEHPENIVWPHEDLKDLLKETYGVMIYQEQIMKTAQIIAGFSLAKADLLRRAVSKKKEKDMASLRTDFLKGAKERGYAEETAEHLFGLISEFAGYGFNKSHAVAYSLIAYQLAWLKANRSLYFYSALLNSVIGDEIHTSQYVMECRRMGIKVEYPDVNASDNRYLRKDRVIVMPLSAVKGVGVHAGSRIMEGRKDGPYKDYYDFVVRAGMNGLSRRTVETLIKAGALDSFGMNRATMLGSLDDVMRYGELVRVEYNGQITIDPDLVSRPVPVRIQDDPEQKAEDEKEALGFCLGPHPVSLRKQKHSIDVRPLNELTRLRGNVHGFALVQSVRQHRTKKGDLMAFCTLVDESGEMSLLVMPKLYSIHSASLKKGVYLYFHGKMTDDGSCIPERIQFYKD